MSSEIKVPCTFESCGLFFNSSDEMQSHKASADKHYYCLKHDKDFPNAALLHLHKVTSEEHFACAECELECRSQAGLNHHVKIVCSYPMLYHKHSVKSQVDIMNNTDDDLFYLDPPGQKRSYLSRLPSQVQVSCRCDEAHRRRGMPSPPPARKRRS
jgi:hypothetical protein